MKKFLASLFLYLVVCFAPNAANAACASATCYWIGTVNQNWNQAGNWSDTPGGLTNASTPATDDNLCFSSDGNTATNANVNVNPKSVNFVDCAGVAGAYTNTFTHTSAVTITIGSTTGTGGVLKFAPSMTYTLGNAFSSAWAFEANAGTNVFTPAVTAMGNITIGAVNGGQTVQLSTTRDLLGGATAGLTLTRGTFDNSTNNKNVSYGTISSSNANTRSFLMGSGTYTLTGTSGTVWNFLTVTGLTATCSSSTISMVAVATGSRNFALAPTATCSYGTISVVNAALSPQYIGLTNGTTSTTGTLTLTNVQNVISASGSSLTTTTTNWTGPTSSNPGTLTTNGTAATLSMGNALSMSYVAVNSWTRSGAGSFTIDCGLFGGLPTSSSGFTFTSVACGGGGGRIIGG